MNPEESIFDKAMKIVYYFLDAAFTLIPPALIVTLPVWLLWNWLMPDLFSLQSINLLQAFGLALLSNCFFKNIDND